MEIRFRNRIKAAVRKLTWSWKPYQVVKNSAKVDSATYECVNCGKYCYTGKSQKSLEMLIEKYPKKTIEMGTIYIDHIDPVEDPSSDWAGWDTYISRLFCEKENLQSLCGFCHDIKSKEENKIRRERRKNGSSKTRKS